jgi:hypothetical protein
MPPPNGTFKRTVLTSACKMSFVTRAKIGGTVAPKPQRALDAITNAYHMGTAKLPRRLPSQYKFLTCAAVAHPSCGALLLHVMPRRVHLALAVTKGAVERVLVHW